jgi:hypothetical protein
VVQRRIDLAEVVHRDGDVGVQRLEALLGLAQLGQAEEADGHGDEGRDRDRGEDLGADSPVTPPGARGRIGGRRAARGSGGGAGHRWVPSASRTVSPDEKEDDVQLDLAPGMRRRVR